VLRTSKRPEPVNLAHCPSCDRHEPFCYSCRHRPTPKNTLRGNPGCAVGPKTPTISKIFIYIIITMNMLLNVSFSNIQLILSILMLEELNKKILVIRLNSI
jgi:hypothetical protein